MNDYISKIEMWIRSSFFIKGYQLNIDRKTENIAFISGQAEFLEASSLDFKEFVEKTDKGIEKYKYGYNYRKGSVLIFRYTAHRHKLKLSVISTEGRNLKIPHVRSE